MKERLVGVCLGLLATGCVTTGTYDKKVAELTAIQEEREKAAAQQQSELKARIDGLEAQGKALEATRAQLEKRAQDTDARLTNAIGERDKLRKDLDDNSALVSELKKRLEKLGQNVDKLTSEKGQLAGALDSTKERLEELRKQKAAAEALAATYESLVAKLKSMIDGGQLKVVVREGRMLIAMPNDVLFDSGRTDLKRDAQTTLTNVAQVLSTIENRRFLVAGHSDNVPIQTQRYPSNWELSAARAVEVTRYLIARGMKPEVLAAAGYGEFDPVAPNDSGERRAFNRRIEIVLQPNLSELPSLEGLLPAGKT